MKIIPKTFQLMGHEYNVILESNIYSKEGIYGDCDPNRKTIRIQKPRVFKKLEDIDDSDLRLPIEITKDDAVETYYHEIVHLILDSMGEEKLYSNEKFVTSFSKCLHQIEKTKKYAAPKRTKNR